MWVVISDLKEFWHWLLNKYYKNCWIKKNKQIKIIKIGICSILGIKEKEMKHDAQLWLI